MEPKRKGHAPPWGPHGGIGGQEAEGVGEFGQEKLLLFPQEGRSEAGQAGLGPGSLNDFSGLWSTGAVPGCPVPGCGVL